MLCRFVGTACFSLALCSFPVQSDAAAYVEGKVVRWLGTGWGGEGTYVITTDNTAAIPGCGSQYFIEPSNPMVKTMTALLLSAFHTGERVSFYVDGCFSNNMIMKSVAISK